jgi:uncharacterized membrane protein required for colicin V production
MNEPDVSGPFLEMTQGSQIWQLIFLVMAAVFLLTKALGGFMSGGPRQFMGLAALVAAYAAAWYSGPRLAPWINNHVAAPDILIIPVAGALVAVVVYAVVVGLGVFLFESARDLDSGKKKAAYQFTGLIIGTVYGVAILGIVLIIINFLGTIGNASVQAAVSNQIMQAELQAQERGTNVSTEIRAGGPAQFFARLHNSLHLGPGEEVISTVDPVPDEVYSTVEKALKVMSNPEAVARFGQHPGMKEFLEDPKIMELAGDPDIAKMASERRFVLLLRDPKIIEAANDVQLQETLMKSEFQEALDFALSNEPLPRTGQSSAPRPDAPQTSSPAPERSSPGPGTPTRNFGN